MYKLSYNTTKKHFMTQKYGYRTVMNGDETVPTPQPVVACTKGVDGRYPEEGEDKYFHF